MEKLCSNPNWQIDLVNILHMTYRSIPIPLPTDLYSYSHHPFGEFKVVTGGEVFL